MGFVIFLGERGKSVWEENPATPHGDLRMLSSHPPSRPPRLVHLLSSLFVPLVDVRLEIDAAPAGQTFTWTVWFFPASVWNTVAVCALQSSGMSGIISHRFHRISLCDMYEPIFICFELAQIASQQQPTAGKHWWYAGISDLEQSSAIRRLAATPQPFYCHFLPLTPSAHAGRARV